MPSELRTPKTLADWVDLDYVKRPRPLRRWWRPALAVALLGPLLYVAWAVAMGSPTAFQAGPVSTAHALFNNDCQQCHENTFQTFGRLWRFNSAVRSVPDSACIKCHSGPIHHETMVEQRSCASCHREHRGRASLARIDDLHCTSCHADLKRNDGRPSDFDPHVTAFAPRRHTEFKLFAKGEPTDPGHIQFNHQKHLVAEGVWRIAEEQVLAQGKKVDEMGFLPAFDIPKELKQRTKLDCQRCHQLDEAGRYMLPIRYEQHCQECHPLGVQLLVPRQKGEKEERLHELARGFRERPAPHPASTQSPEVVRGTLWDRLARFIRMKENQVFLDPPANDDLDRAIPGTPLAAELSREQYGWVNQQLGLVEQLLFDGAGGCRYCHLEKQPAKRPTGLPEYEQSNIKSRWLEHAVFDHKSHQMLACAECHAAQASAKTSDVLLPRIDKCLQCHTAGANQARSDCVECHGYHNREKRREFRGQLAIENMKHP
jgi:hypothetical protein